MEELNLSTKADLPVVLVALTMVLYSLLCFGCGDMSSLDSPDGLYGLNIKVISGAGAPENRLTSQGTHAVTMQMTGVDIAGNELTFSGKVTLKAKTGLIDCKRELEKTISSGQPFTLNITGGYGDVRIWVEDKTTGVAGSSDAIYMQHPTIETIQRPFDYMPNIACKIEKPEDPRDWDRSPWIESFIRIESNNNIVVTGSTLNGFYATDICAKAFNHIYVFTYGPPGVNEGDRLSTLSGVISEYYGLTEISHDHIEVSMTNQDTPCPILLSNDLLKNGMGDTAPENPLEQYEGALVWVDNVFPSSKMDSYGQWKAASTSGTSSKLDPVITIQSKESVPGFDPNDYINKPMDIVGNLRQHYSADIQFIIVPRNKKDIYIDSNWETTTCVTPTANCQ